MCGWYIKEPFCVVKFVVYSTYGFVSCGIRVTNLVIDFTFVDVGL